MCEELRTSSQIYLNAAGLFVNVTSHIYNIKWNKTTTFCRTGILYEQILRGVVYLNDENNVNLI